MGRQNVMPEKEVGTQDVRGCERKHEKNCHGGSVPQWGQVTHRVCMVCQVVCFGSRKDSEAWVVWELEHVRMEYGAEVV